VLTRTWKVLCVGEKEKKKMGNREELGLSDPALCILAFSAA